MLLLLFTYIFFLAGTLPLLLLVFAASEGSSLYYHSVYARSGGGQDRLLAETVQASASLHAELPEGLRCDQLD